MKQKKADKEPKSTKNISIPSVYISRGPFKLSPVFETYWKFAVLRQEVFFNRLLGEPYPWCSDPVLCNYRFTNAYRAADRVSQYLIKDVIYNSTYSASYDEVLFRTLLFKLFNRIETWELLIKKFGVLSYAEYDFKAYDKVLTDAIASGKTIYSAAYIMPSGGSYFGYERKHSNHLKLIEKVMREDLHEQLGNARSLQQAFELIRALPGLGDFLAYQFVIDINYSPILNFSESDFVVPGPGAKGGISKCFYDQRGLSDAEVIKWITERQEYEFQHFELDFKSLWGRPLQLIDCQNLFCEVDKYSRVMHPDIKGNSDRVRIKQKLKVNMKSIKYWFPPKWNLNDKIAESSF